MSLPSASELASTRAFWDANPCGIHGSFVLQKKQRYAMEPWLPRQLADIASKHRSILEVGCGQGVDSIEICSAMTAGGSYTGIDYSPKSIEASIANAASQASKLAVTPTYCIGNAETLDFNDALFDAVYSMGVIHHTANPSKAIADIHRVLEREGKAYVCLYRRPSLKVGAAKALRAIQRGMDRLLGSERCIHTWLRRRSSHSTLFGTMFLECFGVPFMEWYSRDEILKLFKAFSAVELRTYGPNLGRLSVGREGESPFGYLWFVEARK
jgi:ubiquinone/menaquinone biosynthesis C-methylase UbiE